MKKVFHLVVALCLSLISAGALAQDRSTTGSIGGTVTDANGAAIQNATVTVSGQSLGAPRTVTTNDEGLYKVDGLIPGVYAVRIELTGFKAANVDNVEVNVGRESTISLKLEPGQVSEVVNVTDAAGADLATTAIGQNLSDTLFDNIPVQRSVEGLFYLAPGDNDSLGGGRANPSIAGGSALDNLYIADGVNITDSAFGGLGTFTRNFGTLGTGINTSFIKEVQVKTGGFEPQYGRPPRHINIITQSGATRPRRDLRFARPDAFEPRASTRPHSITRSARRSPRSSTTPASSSALRAGARDTLFSSARSTRRARPLVLGAEGSAAHHAASITTVLHQNTRPDRLQPPPGHTLAFSIFATRRRPNVSSFNRLNIDTCRPRASSTSQRATRRYATTAITPTWT